MNTPTPTPRTDAAWAQTFDANGFLFGRGNAASQMRDECATLERELETEKTNRNHFLKKGATLERELTALTAERDQLNEMFHQIRIKLTAACGDPYKLHDEALECLISERDQLRSDCENETKWAAHYLTEARAAEAERDQLRAQLHALQLICGTNDANKFETWIDRANARAERAEAELAAEREKVRVLLNLRKNSQLP